MKTRTFAASILALGFLSPATFAGDNDYCSTNQSHRSEYPPCTGVVTSANTQALQVSTEPRAKKRGSVGAFVDETTEERNQRSSIH
jgi:hypothetical protein